MGQTVFFCRMNTATRIRDRLAGHWPPRGRAPKNARGAHDASPQTSRGRGDVASAPPAPAGRARNGPGPRRRLPGQTERPRQEGQRKHAWAAERAPRHRAGATPTGRPRQPTGDAEPPAAAQQVGEPPQRPRPAPTAPDLRPQTEHGPSPPGGRARPQHAALPRRGRHEPLPQQPAPAAPAQTQQDWTQPVPLASPPQRPSHRRPATQPAAYCRQPPGQAYASLEHWPLPQQQAPAPRAFRPPLPQQPGGRIWTS